MEYSSIFHDMNKRYCYALEKGKFLFRIRTKRNDIKRVILHYQDKYIPVQYLDTRKQLEMKRVTSDSYSDYFEAVISIDIICLRYFFELTDYSDCTIYYGNYEFYEHEITSIDHMFDCPQNLREEEMFCIPEWAKNKIVYQIFPSRFASSKQIPEEIWYKKPIGHKENLQGDLKGIVQRLPYLKDLGIDIIYLTPIFASDSTHKYDTIDYYQIDPSFGTKEDLQNLVQTAHAMGMKVILDGVFNHTSPKFFAFKDIQTNQEASVYRDWYFIEGFPLKKGSRIEKPNYKSFSYYEGMPKLNLRNPETADYFIQVACYWLQEYEIDGWRLDVADEISHVFWKKFRKAIKEINPNALIIGEIWHYAGDFLEGDEWDTVMNYPFYLAVQAFVAKGNISATKFLGDLGFLRGNLHQKVYPVLWNLIDSHDTARFLYMSKEKKEKLKLAAALQLLMTGMPMIYYGDEYGMTGGPDPDCRRGMVWDAAYQDNTIYQWYQSLIQVRKNFPCITEGSITTVQTVDETGLIILTRQLSNQKITLIFHGKDGEVKLPEYTGEMDLITGNPFNGILKAYETIAINSSSL